MCKETVGLERSKIEHQGIFASVVIDFDGDLIAKSMMANNLVREGWEISFELSEHNSKRILIKFKRSWETS